MATKTENGSYALSGLTKEDMEVLQMAALKLAETSHLPKHASRLRKIAMDIDKILHQH